MIDDYALDKSAKVSDMKVRRARIISALGILAILAGAILANMEDRALMWAGIYLWTAAVAVEFMVWKEIRHAAIKGNDPIKGS